MHNEKISRRVLLNQVIAAAAFAPAFVLTRQAIGAAAVPLDPADPMAKALAYAEASAKPDQTCANCAQFQGKAGDFPVRERFILTRCATERAPIFSITLARCISTVLSLRPRSMAMTLLA